ncbi:MAG: histidine--tRNA ligase [Syntrophomonadaceae bacterium]|jgi:histidyl-tRNA synthetase
MQTKAPRGTYDILPPDTGMWQYIEAILKETAENFGYREIRTPIFEHTELFERGVGTSTDIVTKEMYTFKDKSSRSLTLRPENTASCVRALIEHNIYSGIMPAKWYYIGPMFRYDRPQTGRYRQFHQFGVEAFGSNNPYLDAEVIILLIEILNRLGLVDYELHINSVACPQCREVYRQKLIDHITPVKAKLCGDCQIRYQQNPLRVLDCKEKNCHDAIFNYPTLAEYLCTDCTRHYNAVKEALVRNNIRFQHDDKLVRGLDYYTNTAFEVLIPGIGAQSAVGGGGRYNGLVEECGGPNLPGIGFAMGIERLLLAVNTLAAFKADDSKTDVFVTIMNAGYELQALEILTCLRRAGIKADKDYMDRSGRSQMKYADKLGARLVIIIGEEEVNKGLVTVRDMQGKEQVQVDNNDIINFIKQRLALEEATGR